MSSKGAAISEKENVFWTEFLELYESMPCLWKVKSDEYKDRERRNKGYGIMVEKLQEVDPDANRDKVVKKINSLRINYRRDFRKLTKSGKSGAGGDEIFESSLWYFDKLSFLHDQECTLEGRSSMDSDSLESKDENYAGCRQFKKRKPTTPEDELLRLACDKLAKSNDVKSSIAQGWSSQYDELPNAQKVFARAIISDVLYRGSLGRLSEKTVEDIHELLKGSAQASRTQASRTSTPYMDENTRSSFPTRPSPLPHIELEMSSSVPSHTGSFVESGAVSSNYEIIVPNLTSSHSLAQQYFYQPIYSTSSEPNAAFQMRSTLSQPTPSHSLQPSFVVNNNRIMKPAALPPEAKQQTQPSLKQFFESFGELNEFNNVTTYNIRSNVQYANMQ